VNAILRGYLRETEPTRKALADLKDTNPGTGFSHPQWLVEKWQKRFGAESARRLLEWNNTAPKTFARVNTLKTDATRVIEAWRTEDVDYDFVRQGYDSRLENLAFEFKSHPPLKWLKSFQDGWFYVQDPSTLLAPFELAPRLGESILDLCAAPGGKTMFIAQMMNNDGRVVACDVSDERLALIRENSQRLGVTCVQTILASQLSITSDQKFDRILIDAPCSNTGVLRRRVDLRWRVTPEEVLRLQQSQLDLLRSGAAMLKPGGTLVYSTCSLEPEENSVVLQRFLEERKEFKLESERELLPFVDNVDGAFVARLARV
jgi:16S rRNA (cytosine967-C5)-methyltransferase